VNGTAGDDVYQVVATGGGYAVAGLAVALQVDGSEGAIDQLVVNTLAGDDVVEAVNLPAGVVRLMADGGAGADVLLGSQGDDVLLGGDGDDVLDGGAGSDVLDGGPGNDIALNGETLINIP